MSLNFHSIRYPLLSWLVVAIVLVIGSAAVLVPGPNQARSTAMISELVSNYHYSRPKLDDSLSSAMLDRYIESLDPNKHFFMVGDVQSFEEYRYRLDDAFKGADTTPAFEMYNVYKLRVKQRIKHALELLEREFDFSKPETFLVEYEGEPWAEDQAGLDERWRKRVKNDVLSLRLSGKKDSDIRDTLRKRYERVRRLSEQQSVDDVYQVFVNAYTNSIDPHTTYFSPHNSENFNINMRLSLEGIGAALRTKNDYTVVQKIIPGGPADLSKQLKPRDRIIGVAQDQGEIVDVIGWRLQDVVELIRGPKGSVVRLQLLPGSEGVDGETREITLVRDKIKLEDQAAKASVYEDTLGGRQVKIGVIDLPTFYMDFDARARGEVDFKSTTRDVRLIIQDFKAKGVDGIVIDLRGNGGGSLSEATDLTGLFIESGPVVQVKGTRGNIEINEDPDPSVMYEGPLAVLVDHNSASASEIFAGAIQDYGRGIIVGEPTFGKGTVQTLIDLNSYANSEKRLGELKITIAQFFRINGSSTQHRGVRPDIVYPTIIDSDDLGERSLDNALPWDKVNAVQYRRSPADWFNLEQLRNQHRSRVARDRGFDYLVNISKELESVQKKKTVSLVESVRRKERNERRAKSLELENRFRASKGLKALTLKDKDKDLEDDFEEDDRDNDPILKIQLEEAAHILADHIVEYRSRLASRQN